MTSPREDLQALLERVEKAEHHSLSLNHELVVVFGLAPQGMEYCGDNYWGGGGKEWDEPLLTSSIDAALALVERKLPGTAPRPDWPLWLPTIGRQYAGRWYARLYRVTDGLSTDADARTPALALLAALLRALIVKDPS